QPRNPARLRSWSRAGWCGQPVPAREVFGGNEARRRRRAPRAAACLLAPGGGATGAGALPLRSRPRQDRPPPEVTIVMASERTTTHDDPALNHLRRADPVLARLIDGNPGFDPRAWRQELSPLDAFGALLFQVMGQQLSVPS